MTDKLSIEGRLRKAGNNGAPPLGNGCFSDLADETADALSELTRQRDAALATAEKMEACVRELLSLRASPSAGGHAKKPLTVGWLGYWPGAGSINSETKITRWQHEAEAWRKDGATVTELVERAAEAPSPSAVTREPSDRLAQEIAFHDSIAEYLRPFVVTTYDADEMADDITKLSRPGTPESETQPVEGWQAIETAPVACHVIAARFVDCEWVYGVVSSPPGRPWTHWRPLPSPPKEPADV